MELQILNHFLAVAREGSISKAAGSVHLSQSALSKQIISLEKELGVQLLERPKAGSVLTEEGLRLCHRAREIVTLSERARNEMRFLEKEPKREVSIGCTESAGMAELADIILLFRQKNPRITFRFSSGSNHEVMEWLSLGIVDLALASGGFSREKFAALPMKKKDEWGVIVGSSHALASCKRIRPRDLRGTRLVMIRDDAIGAELKEWLGRHREQVVTVMYYNLLSNAVLLNSGTENIVICARPACSYPDTVFLPLEPRFTRSSSLIWNKGQIYFGAVRSFIDHLQQNYCRENKDNI